MSSITGLSSISTPVQTATNGSMNTQMQQLGTLLNEFSLAIMRIEGKSEAYHCTIGQTVLQQIKNSTDDLIKAVQKQATLQARENSEAEIDKIVGYVLNALQCVSCVFSQQWGMLAMMAAFTTLNATGAISAIEKDISTDLQKDDPHMSQQLANFLASVIVVSVIVVGSLIVMRGASAMGNSFKNISSSLGKALNEMKTALLNVMKNTENMEEEEIEMTTFEQKEDSSWGPVEDKAEGASQEVAAKQNAKSSGTFCKLVLIGSQAIMSSNFASNLAALAVTDTSSPTKQAEIQIALELSISLGAAIAGVVATNYLPSAETAVSSLGKTGFARYLDEFTSSKMGAMLFRGTSILENGALLTDAGSEASLGVNDIKLGETSIQYGAANSSILLFKTLMNLFETQFSQYRRVANNQLQGVNTMLAAIGNAYTKVNSVETFRA